MRWLVVVLEWLVLLPLWRAVFRPRALQVLFTGGVALAWLVAIIILATAGGDGDNITESVVQTQPSPTVSAGTEAPSSPSADTSPGGEETPEEQEVTFGGTITGVGKGYGTPGFTMRLLSWLESGIAVDGPYNTGYYTFTAKPGMKFVILQYEFVNDWVKQQETPYLDAGEVLTGPNGYYYEIWNPPLGVLSAEYAPSPSMQDQIDRLGGDVGAYETLLPGESTTGRVVFELPEDMSPVEAEIAHVPAKITFK